MRAGGGLEEGWSQEQGLKPCAGDAEQGAGRGRSGSHQSRQGNADVERQRGGACAQHLSPLGSETSQLLGRRDTGFSNQC